MLLAVPKKYMMLQKAEKREGYTLLNPGSVSIPKEGNPPSYAILEDGLFTIKGFDGTIIKELQL